MVLIKGNLMKKCIFALAGLIFAYSSFGAAVTQKVFFKNNSNVAVCPYILDSNTIISLRPLPPGASGFFVAGADHYAVQALKTEQSDPYTLCIPELISTTTVKACAHSPDTATVSGTADDLQLSCKN